MRVPNPRSTSCVSPRPIPDQTGPETRMDQLGVGLVGHAFMGRAHSQAWRVVNRVFDLPLDVRMTALCGRDESRTTAAARQLGWASAETDWQTLIERDDIDI